MRTFKTVLALAAIFVLPLTLGVASSQAAPLGGVQSAVLNGGISDTAPVEQIGFRRHRGFHGGFRHFGGFRKFGGFKHHRFGHHHFGRRHGFRSHRFSKRFGHVFHGHLGH